MYQRTNRLDTARFQKKYLFSITPIPGHHCDVGLAIAPPILSVMTLLSDKVLISIVLILVLLEATGGTAVVNVVTVFASEVTAVELDEGGAEIVVAEEDDAATVVLDGVDTELNMLVADGVALVSEAKKDDMLAGV